MKFEVVVSVYPIGPGGRAEVLPPDGGRWERSSTTSTEEGIEVVWQRPIPETLQQVRMLLD